MSNISQYIQQKIEQHDRQFEKITQNAAKFKEELNQLVDTMLTEVTMTDIRGRLKYADNKKPYWWRPIVHPIEKQTLELNTILYCGLGGWTIWKNGELFFEDSRDYEFEHFRTLEYVEDMIGDFNETDEYLARLHAPLQEAIYQRQAKNTWLLIDQEQGFA